MKERAALVTGGAGFIGSHVVERLLDDGWRVRVLDNFSTGAAQNLAPFRWDIEVLRGDIRDASACREACAGIDSVFHLAAIASVAASVTDPISSHDVNTGGTLNMLVAARDAGVRRFVFSSSASVYGNADTVPTREDQALVPESPYATTKRCGELYCRNFFQLHGLETVVLRYFNVFGPRQSAVSGYAAVIPAFISAATSGRRPVIYGDGRQTRDFVYVENVAAANLRAALAPGAGGGTFNVAGGRGISLLELLTELERLSGTRLEPEFHPTRPGEVRHSLADISRARTVLGYQPSVDLARGLAATMGGGTPSAAPALALTAA